MTARASSIKAAVGAASRQLGWCAWSWWRQGSTAWLETNYRGLKISHGVPQKEELHQANWYLTNKVVTVRTSVLITVEVDSAIGWHIVNRWQHLAVVKWPRASLFTTVPSDAASLECETVAPAMRIPLRSVCRIATGFVVDNVQPTGQITSMLINVTFKMPGESLFVLCETKPAIQAVMMTLNALGLLPSNRNQTLGPKWLPRRCSQQPRNAWHYLSSIANNVLLLRCVLIPGTENDWQILSSCQHMDPVLRQDSRTKTNDVAWSNVLENIAKR